MINKKDFSPTVYKFKDSVMESVENSDLFNSYIKTTEFTQLFQGTLWAEGPCYIPHNDMLIWSDNPNNRMLKLFNDQVSEFRNPSNFCNGNTLDNDEYLISCSHGGRCIYKIDDNLNVFTLVNNYEGKKLNSPNDVVVKSDGTIWFTDPPYGIMSNEEGFKSESELAGNFVFKVNSQNNISIVVDNFDKPIVSISFISHNSL